MKRSLIIFAFFNFLMATAVAQHMRFGFKGGLDVATMSLNSDVLKADNRLGFFIGPTLTSDVPFTGFGFDASVLFNQREAKVSDAFSSDHLKQQQIVIPVNLRYSIGLGYTGNIFLAAGPQVGFTIGDDVQSLRQMMDQADEWRLKKSNFSVNLGAGAYLSEHFEIGFAYNIALGSTADVTWKNATDDIKSKPKSWQISAAYYF